MINLIMYLFIRDVLCGETGKKKEAKRDQRMNKREAERKDG